MATTDITRFLHRPRQHYVGARMQQGRTILDSDWNEDSLLEAEDRRTALVDLIGCQGSTNAGFRISAVTQAASATSAGYDFDIAPGSFFLGGMRFGLEQTETYLRQSDWLGVDERAQLMPQPPTASELATLPGQARYDLVYLHAWQQPVSAVEDHELRERALGGPDSSTRVRRMRRVEIAPNVGTDIPKDAFDAMFASLQGSGLASYDDVNGELLSSARLTVSLATDPSPSACGPNVPGGYVGYEDQAIRVELRDESHFCWGFCNAAPLYRVRVSKNDPSRLRFITKPRDGEHAPRVGQIVELLSWSAKLPNDEKIAELQGALARVTSGYDPKIGEIVLDMDVPSDWLDWLETHDEHLSDRDTQSDKRYLYLRVWDRGSDTESDPLIKFRPGTAVALAGTGLQVTFDPSGLSGDYWIIAARKATPTLPTPWDLLTGAAPHGTRHFYAPLAVIHWSVDAVGTGAVKATLRDARRRIRRLGERGCCTITVGDGNTSNGLVNDFSDALAELPPAGGRICLLPGTHSLDDADELSGLTNVEIVGCGPQSVLAGTSTVTPTSAIDTQGAPVITLTDCAEIRLRNFKVYSQSRIGVKLQTSNDGCRRVWIENLEFEQNGVYTGDFALPQPAIMALGVEDLWIKRCRIEVRDVISYAPAMVLGGTGIRLFDSWIQAGDLTHPTAPELIQPMGGVHILSQSVDVEIARNVIHGGWGYGIAIGHVLEVDPGSLSTGTMTMSSIWSAGERALGEIVVQQLDWEPHTEMPSVSIGTNVWQPCGAVYDLRIHRNEILNMGLSGIGSAAWGLQDTVAGEPIFLVVVNLDVARNYVHDNARVNAAIQSRFGKGGEKLHKFCLGGVCLSAAISPHFRENHIIGNHLRDTGTPAASDLPNVGIGIIAGQNIIIEDNRIIDNGIASTATVVEGLRGGVAIGEVLPVVGYTFLDSVSASLEVPQTRMIFDSKESTLTVRKNEVSQPLGKALWVRRAFGPVNVTENVLQSFGDPADDEEIENAQLAIKHNMGATLPLPARGACVEICAVALSPEHDWSSASNIPTPTFVDPSSGSLNGSVVVFCGNNTLLDWEIPGGHATSVLISSLDGVVANDNVMVANMRDDTDHGSGAQFVLDILANPSSYSFLLYHCYLGATGTVQARGNRIECGKYHAPFSLLSAGALSPWNTDVTLDKANVVVWNIGTHCILMKEPTVAAGLVLPSAAGNVSIYSVQTAGGGCPDDDWITFAIGTPLTVTVEQV
jgi:hypothetical protein